MIDYTEIKGVNDIRLDNVIVTKEKTKIKIIEIIRIPKGKYYENGVRYICQKDGYEGTSTLSNIKKGRGCPVCKNKKCIKGINDIYTTHNYMVEYFKDIEDSFKYTYASNSIITAKCPDCGYEKTMKINNLYNKGFSCNICSDKIGYPNKFMCDLLKQLKIDFISEYCPYWIKPKRFDFYIPSKSLIIEMDGGLGHGNVNLLKNTKDPKDSLEIDKYKENLAKSNEIKVIRVNCYYKSTNERFSFIRDNIVKSLGNTIDLYHVNWESCNEFAMSNTTKRICNLWNDGLSVKEIIPIVDRQKTAIRHNLLLGSELGWCDYTTEKSKKRGWRKAERKNNIPIVCIDTREVFNSASESARVLSKRLGVKFYQSLICKVLKKETNQHRGLKFKYLSELSEEEKEVYRQRFQNYINSKEC